MQLHTSAFQALGEIGTTLEMSQTRMKGACRFSPRGCIHHVYIPPEFLVGLTCPFAATWLPHGMTVASDQVCVLPTSIALALVSACAWWAFFICAGKRRPLHLLAEDPPLRSNGAVADLADYFPGVGCSLVAYALLEGYRMICWTDLGSSQMVIVESYLVPVEERVLPGGGELVCIGYWYVWYHLSFMFYGWRNEFREVKLLD